MIETSELIPKRIGNRMPIVVHIEFAENIGSMPFNTDNNDQVGVGFARWLIKETLQILGNASIFSNGTIENKPLRPGNHRITQLIGVIS